MPAYTLLPLLCFILCLYHVFLGFPLFWGGGLLLVCCWPRQSQQTQTTLDTHILIPLTTCPLLRIGVLIIDVDDHWSKIKCPVLYIYSLPYLIHTHIHTQLSFLTSFWASNKQRPIETQSSSFLACCSAKLVRVVISHNISTYLSTNL